MKHPQIFGVVIAVLLTLFVAVSAFAQEPVLTGTVTRNANLRSGPSTACARVGSLPAGSTVKIVAKNGAGDWYGLDNRKWIAAFLVKLDAPQEATPTAIATPINTPSPDPFFTGVLGRPRSWWEEMHDYVWDEPGFMTLYFSDLDVRFSEGKITRVEWTFDVPPNPSGLRADTSPAHLAAMILGPVNYSATKVVCTDVEPARDDTMTWLFENAELAQQFKGDVWDGYSPGLFAQIYHINDNGMIDGLVVTTGNQ